MATSRDMSPPPQVRWTPQPPSPRRISAPPLRNIAAVAVGGMIGTGLRLGFALLVPTRPGGFPWTTFAENIVGAFLLGLLAVLLLERWRPRWTVHPLLCTGMLGSFTTFSAFSVETVALIDARQPWLALLYVMTSITAGMIAALLGVALARHWPPFIQRKDTP